MRECPLPFPRQRGNHDLTVQRGQSHHTRPKYERLQGNLKPLLLGFVRMTTAARLLRGKNQSVGHHQVLLCLCREPSCRWCGP